LHQGRVFRTLAREGLDDVADPVRKPSQDLVRFVYSRRPVHVRLAVLVANDASDNKCDYKTVNQQTANFVCTLPSFTEPKQVKRRIARPNQKFGLTGVFSKLSMATPPTEERSGESYASLKIERDWPMRIGTIGAGAVALAVAREALARGHEIVLSSRLGPRALAANVPDLARAASAATVEEAASLAYVLLAVPWKNVEAALPGLPEWEERVLSATTH